MSIQNYDYNINITSNAYDTYCISEPPKGPLRESDLGKRTPTVHIREVRSNQDNTCAISTNESYNI